MPRIAFMGAGSTIFAKSVLGDCILTPEIKDLEIALHDIDPVRLEDSRKMLENIASNTGRKVRIEAHADRKQALRGAKYVVNAIQVGGYDPCTLYRCWRNLQQICRRYARTPSSSIIPILWLC